MPLRLNIRRKLTSRSDRVKCVDLHPDEPWMLCSLYNGTVHLWNYQSQTLLKTFEVMPRKSRCFTPTPLGNLSKDLHSRWHQGDSTLIYCMVDA